MIELNKKYKLYSNMVKEMSQLHPPKGGCLSMNS